MAGPITWRNVSQDTTRGAALLMGQASRSLDSAFNKFGGVINDAEADLKANHDNERVNNTNAAKDILASYQSPEALQAARETGELEAQLKGIGQNVDQDVIRDGFDNRQGELRTQANEQYEFDTNQAKQEASSLEQDFYKALAEDKDGEAQMILDSNQELFAKAGIAGKLQQDYTSTNRSEVMQGRQDLEYNEAQTAKAQNKEFDTIMSDAVSSSGTGAEAHALVVDWAKQNDIPASVYLPRLAEVQTAFGAARSMTPDQVEEHNAYAGQQAAAAEATIQQEQQLYAEAEQQYAVDPASSYADPARAKASQAVTTLSANNWDQDGAAASVRKTVKDWVKANPKAGLKADSPEMIAIVNEAAARMGEPNDLLPGKANVDTELLSTMLTAEHATFVEYQERANLLKKSKQRLNDVTIQAKNTAASNTSANAATYKHRRQFLANE